MPHHLHNQGGDVELIDVAVIAAGNYVKAHPHMWPQYDEILSDAALGAVAAAGRYNPAAGANLATYCGKRAAGQILDGLRKRSPVRRGEFARGCTLDDLPEHRRTPIPIHLLAETGTPEPTPVRELEDEVANSDLVERMLATCTERERIVLKASLVHGYPLADIADYLGVTESRVHQIRSAALKRLRRQFTASWEDAA